MAKKLDFDEVSAYYDEMYVDENNYREEVAQIISIVDTYHPVAKSVLDIACGTGGQAVFLANRFAVTGLDLSPEMVEVAKSKIPAGKFVVADMCGFSLGEKFDAAVNLHGSIGFAEDCDALASSVQCTYDHLNPGGVLILSPWSTRESFREGLLVKSRGDSPNGFCRMETMKRIAQDKVLVELHHLVAKDLEVGYHESEAVVTLFSEEEYRCAIEAAGFTIVARLSPKEFRMGAFVCLKK